MIRFGPAGNGQSFYDAGYTSSLDVPKFLAQVGLNAYEYQCGRGVNVKEEFCRKLAGAAAEHGIALSLHAPYFINLASDDPKVQESSLNHIRKALAAAAAMAAERIVVHPGSVGRVTRGEAVDRARRLLERVLEELMSDYPGIKLCLETMGKINQVGTLEEIIELCQLADCLIPAVDFGHLHARGLGAVKGKGEFEEILARIAAGLGAEVVQDLHIHFSPIEFGKGGELRHRTMAEREYGPHFEPLAEIIVRHRLTPVIISESAGTQVEDALRMQELYRRCLEGEGGEGNAV